VLIREYLMAVNQGSDAQGGIMINETAAGHLIRVNEKIKYLGMLQKALKILASPDALDSPGKVEEACKRLAQADPASLGLEEDFTELLEKTAADQHERAAARKSEFGRLLKECAADKGIDCRLITTDPMEFSVDRFTVLLNFEQNLATLLYAKLPVQELPAKPERIIAAVEKNLKTFEVGWPSERFFEALYKAYKIWLSERKAPMGERAPLAELLAFVALFFQSDRFRTDPKSANYRNYGRVRMAYDLSKLRRNGILSRKGRRLNLGTATGVSTQDKKGVLFVEDSPGQGQYYLSIWFSIVED
jgi:hypothetical protein